MVWVTEAEYEGEDKVRLRFNDGQEEGIVDLREVILGDPRALCQALRDPQAFKDFWVEMDTLMWANGLDLAPEFLYDLMQNPAVKR